MNLVIVYCPYPSDQYAKNASKSAIEAGLAACVNIIPSTSMYKWRGVMVAEQEFVVLFKTLESHEIKLREFLKRTHPYETPAIISLTTTGVNKDYMDWIFSAFEQ